MKMKQRLKGFTLVELVVVMALFSLIMFSVLQLLIPVSRFFVRSGNFESATACMDNMKIAIEGNLKYADRVRCYVDYQPYAQDPTLIHDSNSEATTGPTAHYTPSADMYRHVQNFYNEFFGRNKSQTDQNGRECADTILTTNDGAAYADSALRDYINCRGTIYVMVFDNSTPADYFDRTSIDDISSSNGVLVDSLQRFNQLRKNAGKIVLYEFPFNNTSGEFEAATAAYTVHPWYVNQKLYGNFDYQFILNDQDLVTAGESSFDQYLDPSDTNVGTTGALNPGVDPATLTEFRPEDCTIWIRSYEIKKVGGENQMDAENIGLNGAASRLMRNILFKRYSSSFSMKNVLEAEGAHENLNYEDASMDYKIFHDPAMAGYVQNRTTGQEYFQDMLYPIPRYLPPFIRTNALNGDYAAQYANRPEHQEPCEGPNYASVSATVSTPTTGFRNNLDGTLDVPGFYFIFTLPETTTGFAVDQHGNVSEDNGYLQAVNNAFANPPT
ncbi:MAG: type II secretion system protein [Oscillospiraceae bacterium]|nr:type II secretion system protein [Oscillospiraceae bacterium]